ncbi:MAG: TonB family protein [Acidobacteriaceae bacterium]|jgi:TonB family protein
MIFSTDRIHQRRQTGILLSLASHAAVLLVAFLLTLHFGRVRPVYRESRCCTAALYWTGNTGVSDLSPVSPHIKRSIPSPVPIPKSSLIENPIRLRQPRTPQHPAPAAQNHLAQAGLPSRQQQQTIGTGTGTDDAEPAFPTYFPRPAVTDRSVLPAVEQKIIVDVTISAQGDVTDEKLVQGLGNNLDDLVMKTVKSWRFHPATLNGSAIASVEQLVFPFNRDYPSDEG